MKEKREHIIKLISEAKISDAIDKLNIALLKAEKKNELTLLTFRYNKIKKEFLAGLITKDKEVTESNRIALALIGFVNNNFEEKVKTVNNVAPYKQNPDKELTKKIISRLDNSSFFKLFKEIISNSYHHESSITELSQTNKSWIWRENEPQMTPYEWAYKASNYWVPKSNPESVGLPTSLMDPTYSAYVFDSIPLRAIKDIEKLKIDTSKIVKDFNHLPNRNPHYIYFINNVKDYKIDEYTNQVLPIYRKGLEKYLPAAMWGAGTIDSLVDASDSNNLNFIYDFLSNQEILLSIGTNPTVSNFHYEKPIDKGINQQGGEFYVPMFASKINEKKSVIKEFEYLIENQSDAALKMFIKENYLDIFGSKFQIIEPSLFFGSENISTKESNIFFKNNILNQVEMVKISNKLMGLNYYEDIDTFSNIFISVLNETRNLQIKIEKDSEAIRCLKSLGLNQFKPSIKLLFRKPININFDYWQEFSKKNYNNINLLPHDQLIEEMELRLIEKINFLNEISK